MLDSPGNDFLISSILRNQVHAFGKLEITGLSCIDGGALWDHAQRFSSNTVSCFRILKNKYFALKETS